MKRKKQILLYLLLMAICVGGYMKLFDYRLTPHQYFAAEEKYQHVGPSEEILLEGEGAEGTYFILGKWGQNLNYCVMERCVCRPFGESIRVIWTYSMVSVR